MLRLAWIGSEMADAYARIAGRLRGGRFAAVVHPDLAAARRHALALDAEVWCSDFDALLSQHGAAFDAVLVCGHPAARAAACQRAAAAGKHVLVESPLATSTAAAKDLLAASAATGVRLMVGRTARFLPQVRAVRQSLESGQLGELGLVRIHRWEPLDLHAAADGGSVWHDLAREIDLACWLFGGRPTLVYATAPPAPCLEQRHAEYVQVHLGFAEGGMALLDCARALPRGGAYYSLSAIGSTGAAYADDHANMQLLFAGGNPAAILADAGDLHVLAELQEFVASIAHRRVPLAPGEDGLRALEVVEAAAASIATGEARRWRGERYEAAAAP